MRARRVKAIIPNGERPPKIVHTESGEMPSIEFSSGTSEDALLALGRAVFAQPVFVSPDYRLGGGEDLTVYQSKPIANTELAEGYVWVLPPEGTKLKTPGRSRAY